MSKILKALAVVLAVIGFCMLFAVQMNFKTGPINEEIGMEAAFFEERGSTIVPFVGYMLILLGGVFALGSIFMHGKLVQLLFNILCGVSSVVGASLVFAMPQLYMEENLIVKGAVESGVSTLSLSTTTILAGIFGLAIAILIIIAAIADIFKRKRR